MCVNERRRWSREESWRRGQRNKNTKLVEGEGEDEGESGCRLEMDQGAAAAAKDQKEPECRVYHLGT